MNEKQRVQQVLSGNASAFGYFADTYQDMAITIAFRICGNVQDAEDIVQDSYLKAYRNLHSFRGDSKFSTWLYRIVYNTAITHSKSKMWQADDDLSAVESIETSDFDTEKIIDDAETAELVNATLEKMPKGDALLLTLFYLEDNSIKEMAKITGLNETNVRVKLFRARKLFKKIFVQELQIPAVNKLENEQ
jgi:RNA polymerase sigma-70 factor (ECF subfamily)